MRFYNSKIAEDLTMTLKITGLCIERQGTMGPLSLIDMWTYDAATIGRMVVQRPDTMRRVRPRGLFQRCMATLRRLLGREPLMETIPGRVFGDSVFTLEAGCFVPDADPELMRLRLRFPVSELPMETNIPPSERYQQIGMDLGVDDGTVLFIPQLHEDPEGSDENA